MPRRGHGPKRTQAPVSPTHDFPHPPHPAPPHEPRGGRRHAPPRGRPPTPSEMSAGLPPKHATGRFKPPHPPVRHEAVRGEHAADRPRTDDFNAWLQHRFHNPDHHDERRVLGIKGAMELERSRQAYKNLVFNIHNASLQAHAGPEANVDLSDFTGLTPEQIAEGRKAMGTEPTRATQLVSGALHGRLPTPVGHLPSIAGTGEAAANISGAADVYENVFEHPGRHLGQIYQGGVKPRRSIAEEEPAYGIVPWASKGKLIPDHKLPVETRTKLDAATVELSWGQGKVEDLAKKYKVNPKQFADYAMRHSDRLTGRILSNEPIWRNPPKDYRQNAMRARQKVKLDRNTRTISYGDMTTWAPPSPSRPTLYAQRLLDRFSERLAGPVDVLRESPDWKRYRLGQALTPLSARGKVPKLRSTRVQRLGQRRAMGRTAEERRVLRQPGHFMGVRTSGGEQMAHAVWIQLPEAQRNVGGLKLWRDEFLHKSLADYTDMSETGFAARVRSYIDTATTRMQQEFKAGDVASARRTQAEIQDLRAVQQDLPSRISDVQDEIKKFNRLIEKPPKYNPDVADAARTLNKEAEQIMQDEGLLHPEEAATRAGKVSKALGLESDGSELYFHHGIGEGRRAAGAGAGLGRPRAPEGAGQHLGLALARSGRVRLSLEPVIEHWQQAQSYQLQGIMRDDLAAMGPPLSEKPGFRPGPDDLLVNKEGRPKLRSWQRDPEVIALEESLDPEGFHIKNLEEALRSAVAEGPDRERLIQEAIDAGQLDQLHVVPRDVFNRYIGQYKDYATVVPGMKAIRGAADAVNSMIYTSLIYANPGYIPANLFQNFIMHFLQAGVFVPSDLARTIQILQVATKEGRGGRMQRLRDQMRSEIGHGPTVEAAANIKGARAVTRGIAMIPDDPLRMSAFIHEAARLGVIPKWLPKLREKDIKALEDLHNDPTMRDTLNTAQDRAVQAMVDFERLGPKERAILKRLMFVWSWTRGGSRYPFRFALDHPGRTAVMGYLIAGAPGGPKELQDKIKQFMPTVQQGMPPWLEGALHMGTKTIGGKEYPVVLPTKQISPVSQPWDIFQTARSAKGSQTVGELLNPGIPAGWHILNKESPYGRKLGSYQEAALQEWERMQPAAKLAGGLISPSGDTKLYPEDATRWGRLKRALRVFPYAVDMEEAAKARVREGLTSTRDNFLSTFEADAKKYLHHAPPPYVTHEARVKFDLDHRLYKEAQGEDRKIDYGKAMKLAEETYFKEKGHHIKLEGVKTQAQAHAVYLAIRVALFPAYSAYRTYLDRAREAARGQQGANVGG